MDVYLTLLSFFAPANAGIINSGFGLCNSSCKRKTVYATCGIKAHP
jgi:hypothetical protein